MKDNSWQIFFMFVIIFLIGCVVGMLCLSSYYSGGYEVYSMSIYACQDGCSIATKNLTGDGFLNNQTWICWDKCDEYVKEVLKELGGTK